MAASPTAGLKRLPRQQRSRETVQQIFEATVALLRERSILDLNTNLIAATAGVDISSLYRFFADKEAIVFQLADDWLAEIRQVYDRYEEDPELLGLPWREYFTRLLEDWRLPDQDEKYAALAGLWRLYPALVALDEQQLAHHISFFVRQFRRFKARGKLQQWRDLAIYLYLVEDVVHEAAGLDISRRGAAVRKLYYDTFFFHLEQFLDG
jgi:AcrR family transcriptional regulator